MDRKKYGNPLLIGAFQSKGYFFWGLRTILPAIEREVVGFVAQYHKNHCLMRFPGYPLFFNLMQEVHGTMQKNLLKKE